MSEVIKKYEGIIESAKNFDTWFANQMSKHPLEVALSKRLSLMIKESEIVLKKRLEEFNLTKDSETDRLNKLSEQINKERKELTTDTIKHFQEVNSFLDSVAEQRLILQRFEDALAQYALDKSKLAKDVEEYNLLNNNLKERERLAIEQENNNAEEKKGIAKCYADLKIRQEEIRKIEEKIAEYKIEEIKQNQEAKKKEIEKLLANLEVKFKESEEIEKSDAIRRKNLDDKERNLDAYKAEIESQNSKFRQELAEEKKKLGIK